MSDCSTHAFDVPMSNRYTHRFGDAEWHEPKKYEEYPGMRRIERIVFTDSSEHIVNSPFVAVDKEVWAITLDNGEAYMFHERLADTNGKLCAEVNELEEHIETLEELVRDLWPRTEFTMTADNRASWKERMAELGIEVDR